MPVHSAVFCFSRWLLTFWRRILSAPRVFAQRSIRLLYLLLALLRRRSRRKGPSDDDRSGRDISPLDRTLNVELGDPQNSFTIYASTVPHPDVIHASERNTIPVTQPSPTASARPTHDSLHPYTYLRDAASRSSPNMGHGSEASRRASQPNLVTPLSPIHESLRLTSFTKDRTSRSSHNLGGVSEISHAAIQPASSRSKHHESLHPYSFAGAMASRSTPGTFDFGLGSSHQTTSMDRASITSDHSVISLAPSRASHAHSRFSNSGRHSPRPMSIHSVQYVPAQVPLSRIRTPDAREHPTRPPSPLGSSTAVHSLAVPARAIHLPPTPSVSESDQPAFDKRIVFAMPPEWSERYDRESDINPISAHFVVEPMTRTFIRDDVPLGWVSHVHPEGALYFFHEEKKIITDAHICEPAVLADIEMFYEQIQDIKTEDDLNVPPDVHLVMELMPSSARDQIVCGYYLVDHKNRSVFWLREFTADSLLENIYGDIHPTHIKHAIECQYWRHQECFPHPHDPSKDDVDELRGILIHAIGDALTSSTSTVTYSPDELTSMLNLANEMKDGTERDPHAKACLGRMMAAFAHQKFTNYHGQKCPRLCRNQSIFNEHKKRSLIMTLFSPILFSAPDVHMRALDDMFVDHVVVGGSWKAFIEKLNQEWQDFLLLGEVLLTVNVSFLAIPSVDTTNPGQNANPQRSLPQISSYVSIVATVASIIMGLLLVRQNRTKARDTAEEALHFLGRMSRTTLGLETLAILFSLPYALLMWGMLSFVVAFSSLCLLDTELPSRLSVGTSGAAVLALVIWCIWTAWETRNYTLKEWWEMIREFSRDSIRFPQFLLPFPRKSMYHLPSAVCHGDAVRE